MTVTKFNCCLHLKLKIVFHIFKPMEAKICAIKTFLSCLNTIIHFATLYYNNSLAYLALGKIVCFVVP